MASDIAMSWAENTEGDRAGVDRRFQYLVTVLPNGVGLLDKNRGFRIPEDEAFILQSSRR